MKSTCKQDRRVWVVLGTLIGFLLIGLMFLSSGPQAKPTGASTAESDEQPSRQVEREEPLPILSGATNILATSPIAADYAALDPSHNGWSSEAIHGEIAAQLKRLAQLLQDSPEIDARQIEQLVSPDFSSGYLRPRLLETVLETTGFTVKRPPASDTSAGQLFRSIEGAVAVFTDFAAPLQGNHVRRLDVKIYRVTLESGVANCRAAIVFSGLAGARPLQQNATWECRWSVSAETPPRLLDVKVSDYEEVSVRADQGTPFVDVADSLFGSNDCWREQLVPGLDYWTARIEQGLGMYLDGWSGIAIGDVNNDGLDDVYVCQPGGLPNRLFLHQADGTAIDVSREYRVDWLDRTTGALFLDLNNNGRQDLVVAIQGGVLVLENTGASGFRLRQSIPTSGQPYSLAAADFDGDSLLDVYVCCYNRGARAAQQGGLDVPVPYYDANNGAANLLLKNQGNFLLSDVAADTGMGVNNQRFSYAAAWEDFDNDGDQDLYVANDFGRNNLYRNDGGLFADVAAQVGVEDMGSGMSVAWSDYNGDGWMDVYVGNMFSAAGSRITYQRQFASAFNDTALASVRRLAGGNTLFENAGDGTMRDVSREAGVSLGRWAWSSNFVDINNDGREDLIVANGFVTGSTDVDL